MNIDQLRYLILIDLHGSINKASEQAHISQQAMNVSMTKLEDEIGCPLFHRHARGMSLTENGQLLRKTAEEILLKLDDTLAKMHEKDDKLQEKNEILHIYISPAIGNSIISPLIKKFTHIFPLISPMIIEKETDEIISQIKNNTISAIGIVASFNSLPDNSNMYITPLYTDKLYAAVSPAHPLSKQKSISLSTILKYPLAIYQNSDKFSNPICQLLESIGTPMYHTITNNQYVYTNIIRNQNVVGFINKSMIKTSISKEHLDDLIFLPIKNAPLINIFCLAPSTYYSEHQRPLEGLISICKTLF